MDKEGGLGRRDNAPTWRKDGGRVRGGVAWRLQDDGDAAWHAGLPWTTT
jgi:hypothetical protein